MRAVLAIVILALAGCASTPNRAPAAASAGSTKPSAERGDQAAGYALTMVGRPYRYGGSSPSGFDCSGLVLYSYKNAGLALPHGTDKQRALSRPVKLAELRRGDLLFVKQEGQ